MPKRSRKPEIMAPAGDFPCLDAAIRAGADAVYFGLDGMNMRAGARNFTPSGMRRLGRICAEAGVKSYLALNTIYYEGEYPALLRAARSAKSAGIGAAIAWDPAAVEAARAAGLEVFLSTQASASNSRAIAFHYRHSGIRRFVLARECGISDIKKIRAALPRLLGAEAAREIRLEVFAHGAMCVSISGRCFMSLFGCAKSANRGECSQPCRREYFVHDGTGAEGMLVGRGHVMSPRDLCTMPFLELLLDAGADSLKIEGRNRNPEYVFETVGAYRKAVDFYFERKGSPGFGREFESLKSEMLKRLESVFNRGFSPGFYLGEPSGDWTSPGNMASRKKAILGRVRNYYPKISVAHISVENAGFAPGDEIQLEGPSTGFMRFSPGEILLDGRPVARAKKGDEVSVKVPGKVRKNDLLYVFRES